MKNKLRISNTYNKNHNNRYFSMEPKNYNINIQQNQLYSISKPSNLPNFNLNNQRPERKKSAKSKNSENMKFKVNKNTKIIFSNKPSNSLNFKNKKNQNVNGMMITKNNNINPNFFNKISQSKDKIFMNHQNNNNFDFIKSMEVKINNKNFDIFNQNIFENEHMMVNNNYDHNKINSFQNNFIFNKDNNNIKIFNHNNNNDFNFFNNNNNKNKTKHNKRPKSSFKLKGNNYLLNQKIESHNNLLEFQHNKPNEIVDEIIDKENDIIFNSNINNNINILNERNNNYIKGGEIEYNKIQIFKEQNENNMNLPYNKVNLLENENNLKKENESLKEEMKKFKVLLKEKEEQKKKQIILQEEQKYLNLLNLKDKKIEELNEKILKNNKMMENQKKIINEYEIKINYYVEKLKNKLSDKNANIIQKEEELNKRSLELEKKEKEFNRKMNFLEDKENQLEKEKHDFEIEIENHKYKDENKLLNNKEIEELKSLKFKYYKKPIKLYLRPTLIGLNNIGATCFINSTLQCLSQTEALTNYFLNANNKEKIINNNIALKNKNNCQLSPIYLELIQKLWEKNEDKSSKSLSPDSFIKIINEMNPLFKKGEAGDSKDFIIFILEQFHKELKKPINSINNNNLKKNEPLNQYDKNNAFNHFFSDFAKETSIISDIFFGINETTNECINCKNKNPYNNPICYNYGIFNCLIFPLEEVKKMKNNSFSNNNIIINNNRVSLDECFFYNQKGEYFNGQNQNYCNICKQTCDSLYTSKIYSSPNVLILILNRGKGNIYDVKLDFNETIDITDYVLQKDKIKMIYNLYGVITHIGESGPNAHFVASCKSKIDNKWYRYNDAIVSDINNVQKEIIEFGTPYILFYKKNELQL